MGPRNIAIPSRPANGLHQLTIAATYFVLAAGGLVLAVDHPSASAIWPATGFALAAVLLWGMGVWPAIFIGASLANAVSSGDILPSLGIATGNTLEALAAGYMLQRWTSGQDTFETPGGVASFALVIALATQVSAIIGIGVIWLAGSLPSGDLTSTWLTWWLGDLAGALVVTPTIVLWFRRPANADELPALLQLIGLTVIAGLIAFTPALATSSNRGLFAFVAIVPLLWAALYRSQRDTATVAVLLCALALWGTGTSASPATQANLNDALLMTLFFVVSSTLPSLALSAEVSTRRHAEEKLRTAHDELETKIQERTAELSRSNAELRHLIDETKALEIATRQQRIQLVEAQRLANLGSWSWNVGTGHITWSPQLYEIYGIAPEAFDGTIEGFLSRFHPDDRVAVSETLAAACRSGNSFRSEERIVLPNGDIRHLKSSGKVIKDANDKVVELLGICQDITSQKANIDARRESEGQFRRLINGIHDYAIFMLDADGRIVSWNPGAARIKQYSHDEVIGQHISLFYTPEEQAAGLPDRALRTAALEGRCEGEGWRVRKDGTRFWANVVIDAIHDSDGNLVGFGKITRDVTEKREAQLALEEARDQLAQAQKMEAIGQITGGVAHDFNNLLAAIISSLKPLEKGLSDDPKSKRLLENAVSAAERGASLTHRLLTFARRQDLKPEIVDVAGLLDGMTDLLRRSLGPSITIETSLTAERSAALIDPSQLELAIFNLALNARDAMPKGGTLSIGTAHAEVSDTKSIPDLQPGRYVLITVSDTGAGMDENTLNRAAEPFFTTKGIGKGTGLGLSMVQGFAAQSEGAMKIRSSPGQGTTVSVWLPASDQEQTQSVPKSPDISQAIKTCRVLVVDDDPLVAMGTVAMLEDLGHSVVEASSGRQALSVLQSEIGIDVVITDQVMPGMTGIELVQKIRELDPRLPIILATGWTNLASNPVPDLLRLSKPYRQEDLAIALGRVLHSEEPT